MPEQWYQWIAVSDESTCTDEVHRLLTWSSENNLALNTLKAKELVISFRRTHTDPTPIHINGATEDIRKNSPDPISWRPISGMNSWSNNTRALKNKAKPRLYFLHRLKTGSLELQNLLLSLNQKHFKLITLPPGSITALQQTKLPLYYLPFQSCMLLTVLIEPRAS